MTLASIKSDITLSCDGIVKTFDFDFKVWDEDELAIYLISTLGIATQVTSNFSVTLNADQETSPGGTLTYPVTGDAISNDYDINIARSMPFTQSVDFQSPQLFNPESLELMFDRMKAEMQQINALLRRIPTLAPGLSTLLDLILPPPGAGYYLRWNSAGTALEAVSTVTVGDLVLTVTDTELNQLAGAGVLAADFVKLHAIAETAATINKLSGILAGTEALSGLIVNGNADISNDMDIGGALTVNSQELTAEIDEINKRCDGVPNLKKSIAGSATLTTLASDIISSFQIGTGDLNLLSYYQIEIQTIGTKGGTGGKVNINCEVYTGSGTAKFGDWESDIDQSIYVAASDTVSIRLTGLLRVVGAGTIYMRVRGSSQNSNFTISTDDCKFVAWELKA